MRPRYKWEREEVFFMETIVGSLFYLLFYSFLNLSNNKSIIFRNSILTGFRT